jgi:tetratricopeptide (TPR) repeat protein
VGRTIRICSALLIALMPIAGEARQSDPSAVSLYVRARIGTGTDQAAKDYSAALTADPASTAIAFRAYREAVEAGDYMLAQRSAGAIERAGAIPPDAHILQYVAALRNGDWEAAKARLTLLGEQPGLGFLAPMFAGWLELATRAPVSVNRGKAIESRPNAYAAENAALLALAKGDTDPAVLAIKELWTLDPYRAGSLRLAAASLLADRKAKDGALSLLVAHDAAADAARAQIAAGKSLGVSVASPLDGAAFLLARIAGDLIVEGSGRSALTMARLAAFAAPDNARIRLMVAGALAARKRHAAALTITEQILGDPVYGDDAASLRIDELEALARIDRAVELAAARAHRSLNDESRIGDIEARRGNHAAALQAYSRVIDKLGDKAQWPLVYAAANAAESAGSWAEARPLLERALTIAPDQPLILNELGYGLVTRGEDADRGRSLITRAAELAPDNAAIVDSLGWSHFKRGALGEAIPLLERAARLDVSQPEISEHLGDAYWRAGRRIEARYAWAAARILEDGEASTRLDAKISDGLARP